MGLFGFIKNILTSPNTDSVFPSNGDEATFSIKYEPASVPPTNSPSQIQPESIFKSDIRKEIDRYDVMRGSRMNNMNCDLYSGTAVYLETHRKRKLLTYLFPGEDLRNVVVGMGFDPDTMQVKQIEFDLPTDLQIDAFERHGDSIPDHVCKEDVSALIDRLKYKEDVLCPELFRFAELQRLPLSKFSGIHTLDFVIQRNFDYESYVAFYIVCVEHDMTGEWRTDKFDYYKSLSEHIISIDQFSSSFKRGDENIFEKASSRKRNCYIVAKNVILGLK